LVNAQYPPPPTYPPAPYPQAGYPQSNAQLVAGWYQRYLGRQAESATVQTLAEQLDGGASPIEIQAGIFGSPEYYQRSGGRPWQFVAALYRDIVGRSPSRAELDSWMQRLNEQQSFDQGMPLSSSRRQIALALLQSVSGAQPAQPAGYFGTYPPILPR
jgi:hypothetical protein